MSIALWWALAAALPAPQGVDLADVYRFPPACVVAEYRSFAYQRWRWLDDNEYIWFRSVRYQQARAAAKLAYFAVDDLDTALRENIPLDSRLWALGRLKELLGDDDYYAGRMPLP